MSTFSKSSTSSWDLSSCIEFIRRGVQSGDAAASAPPDNGSLQKAPIEGQETGANKAPSLGNFYNIFKQLGTRPVNIPQRTRRTSSSDEVSTDTESYTTSATSPPDDIILEDFDSYIARKYDGWNKDVQNIRPGPNTQHQTGPPGGAEEEDTGSNQVKPLASPGSVCSSKPQATIIQTSATIFQFSGCDSEADLVPITPLNKHKDEHIHSKKTPSSSYIPYANQLTPAWVTPPRVEPITFTKPQPFLSIDTPQIFIDPTIIQPILLGTRDTKQLNIADKLLKKFGVTSNTLEDDLIRAMSQIGGNKSPDGIHVFVDSSNITIGFRNALIKARGINKNAYTKFPPISYHSLTLIMERGRGVAKRVLVGSSRENVRPSYMTEAVRCGYEVSTLERVEKFKEAKVFKGSDIEIYQSLCYTGTGYTSSGSSSEAPLNTFKTVTEQGVDEILHMKMLESIVDTKEPSTMVLATGDAAAAEYSDGFLRNVERALEKGWKVELVSWRDCMSSAYKNRDFRRKWKDKFTVLELDEFQEELLEVYTDGLNWTS